MDQPRRRARGTAGDAVPLYLKVATDAKEIVDSISDLTGAPKWQVLEEILRHVERDENGLPVWWPAPHVHQEAFEIPA